MKRIIVFFKDYFKQLYETFIDIRESNNRMYTIILNKGIISSFLVLLAILFGTIGEVCRGNNFINAFFTALQLFALSLPDKEPKAINFLTGIAFLFALATISLIAVVITLKDFFEKRITKNIMNNHYSVIFGLGEINRGFLNNIQNNKEQRASTLIIEKDPSNKFIEEYRQKGFGVLIGNSYDIKYDYQNMQYAIIAFGEDRYNIDFARKIIQDYNDDKNDLKLIVHIENKDLEILFHTKFIDTNEKKINIKTFSFYEEVAKDLFNKHNIDGNTTKYMESNKEFKSIVIADGFLLEKIIYQIALISHLPNENIHTVIIVDKKADQLLIKVKKALYYKEQNFPTLKLEAINLDKNNLEFYESDIWQVNTTDSNLVNIIIGYDDEKRNLDMVVELYNRIYLKQAIDKLNMPKILFGIFNELLLSSLIDENKDEFNNFYTFGNICHTLNYAELIDEESNKIAQLINHGYGDEYDSSKLGQDDEKVKKKWFENSKFSDKLSNLAQAKHLDIKLKSMGLRKVKSKKKYLNEKDLLKINQQVILDKFIEERKLLDIGEETLKLYSKELEKFWCYLEIQEMIETNNFSRLENKDIPWWCIKYSSDETKNRCNEILEKLQMKILIEI